MSGTALRRARWLRDIAAAMLLCAFPVLGPAWARSNCSGTSVGLIPIDDLGVGAYQSFQGGLYPGGANARPISHDIAADGVARLSLLDPNGAPNAATGRIVLLTVGMSNTSIESGSFIPLALADPGRNTRVTIVNGAQGGWTASRVIDPNQNAVFWSTIDQRLTSSGVTPLQVQAVWLKEAEAGPTQPFPQDAQILQSDQEEIVRMIHDRYPNARQVYVSSRIYAGYATTSLNPEPYSYQSGFSVKWMIEKQLAGNSSLNFDPARGIVEAPWMAWGPYLWADGLTPRSDGLTWLCGDLRDNDGTHPSDAGAAKVAQLLVTFFQDDPVASRWYMDCDPNVPEVFAAPPRVLDLSVAPNPVSGLNEVRWQSLGPVAGAGTRYDVVTGTLGSLRQTGGFSGAACALANVPSPGGLDPAPNPAPGGGIYYLVRGRNACGIGTYGEPDASPGPRGDLDQISPCNL